jgi:hypothetical protein
MNDTLERKRNAEPAMEVPIRRRRGGSEQVDVGDIADDEAGPVPESRRGELDFLFSVNLLSLNC